MSGAVPRSRRHVLTGAVPLVLLAASDPGSTRLVYAMVAGLALIGIVFIFLGLWLIRQTRADLPVLAPLERMGERDWKKKDAPTQRRLLDEMRPPGAVPLRSEPDPPLRDREFDEPSPPASLSDLGPGVEEPKVPTPTEMPRPKGAEIDVDELDREAESGLNATPVGEERPLFTDEAPPADADAETEPETETEPEAEAEVDAESEHDDDDERDDRPAPEISW